MRDSVGLFMRAENIDTAKPTYAAAQPAFDKLNAAFSDNKIDGTNGNEYVNDLGNGNLAAAFAWSGDVAQITKSNPDVRFAVPGLRRDALVGQLHDPVHDRQGRPRERVHQLLLRPEERGDPDRRSSSTSRRSTACRPS